MSAPSGPRAGRALLVAAAALLFLGLGAWLVVDRARRAEEAALRAREAAEAARAALSARSDAPEASAEQDAAPADAGRIVRGASPDGDLQEALAAALKAAQASQPGADMRLEWTLEAIRGVRGGIRGENEVVVEIRVR
ncbi:MAG: hypothetical protein RL112_2268 [Planctomycetota bacterium]